MIELPWPPRVLHPNARPHYHAKAKAAKEYRAHAFWATRASGQARVAKDAELELHIMFHPPSHRRADLDGMLSSIKNGLDGISDAIGSDDSNWQITIKKGQPEKGGKVAITITGQTNEGLRGILECLPTQS